MITEDYVSFETAKLLKEKGFDEPCWSWYHNGNNTHTGASRYCNSELEKYDFSKATLAHVMKWLREVHNIDVSIIPLRSHKEYLPRVESDITSHDAIPCRKYEEACEAAIKYCLENLI